MTCSISPATATCSSQLIHRAALELEGLREHQSDDLRVVKEKLTGPSRSSLSSCALSLSSSPSSVFPPACLSLLRSIEGNRYCVDCAKPNPDWASITYGTLLCLRCCGRHRSYGVHTSFTRSLEMDSWSYQQVLAMLEGGNQQIQQFFERHHLGSTMLNCDHDLNYHHRYHTKAAKFYKVNLAKHTKSVSEKGLYQGREANRPSSRDANVIKSSDRRDLPTSELDDTIITEPLCCTEERQRKIRGRHKKAPSETTSSSSSICYAAA